MPLNTSKSMPSDPLDKIILIWLILFDSARVDCRYSPFDPFYIHSNIFLLQSLS